MRIKKITQIITVIFLLLLVGLSTRAIAERDVSAGHGHEQDMISQQIQSEIVAANKMFMLAFKNSDDNAMASLYTENAQLLPTNSDFVSGNESVKTFWKSVFDAGIKQAKLETLEVKGMGGTAVEVGQYTLYVEDNQVADSGKYIVYWKKVNGEWKLHRDIWNTSLPAAQ